MKGTLMVPLYWHHPRMPAWTCRVCQFWIWSFQICSILLVMIAFPTLAAVLLPCCTDIPANILWEKFKNKQCLLSIHEHSIKQWLRDANSEYHQALNNCLTDLFSWYNCLEVPNILKLYVNKVQTICIWANHALLLIRFVRVYLQNTTSFGVRRCARSLPAVPIPYCHSI